jgi:dTDP-L-rhamnose 4-epimerase
MNILITGGAGFIGSSLSCALLDRGHVVTVIDSLSPQIHGLDPIKNSPLYAKINGRIRIIIKSVTDPTAWDEALPGQDAVVHLAAETGTGQSMYEIRRYVDTNIAGTAQMLESLAKGSYGVKKLVVASSRALYGEGRYRDSTGRIVYPGARDIVNLKEGRFELYDENNAPLELMSTDESSKLHPSSVYGITKMTQEQMIMTVCPTIGISPVALRYQNVYGPGQSLSNPYTGILSIFSNRILNKKPIQIFEDGLESRDFVHIQDVVSATLAALMRPEANGEVIGIGSGVATSVMDAASTLVSAIGQSVPIKVIGSFRVGDIRHNFADLEKAHKLLSYQPVYKFNDGIQDFAHWVIGQPLQQDRYEESLRELEARGLMYDS